MKTFKGTWIDCNRFYTEDKKVIRVYPHQKTLKQYQSLFPLKCYMMITSDNTVKEIVISF